MKIYRTELVYYRNNNFRWNRKFYSKDMPTRERINTLAYEQSIDVITDDHINTLIDSPLSEGSRTVTIETKEGRMFNNKYFTLTVKVLDVEE